jgi:hypothetical protein
MPYALSRYHPRPGDVHGGRRLYGGQSHQGAEKEK